VSQTFKGWLRLLMSALLIGLSGVHAAESAGGQPLIVNLSLNGLTQPQDVDVSVRIVVALTLLGLAPSILILMTGFTRVIIVFSLLKNALGLGGAIPNQLVVGFSLILTFFIMGPVIHEVETNALTPYRASTINSSEALERAGQSFKAFMLRQTRTKEIEFFVGLSGLPPTQVKELPLKVVVPAFVLNELRTGFQMGFLLYLPFLLVDYVVAVILMSLGLMFLPPGNISLPLKILLFVLVDGWSLVTRSLVLSFTGSP